MFFYEGYVCPVCRKKFVADDDIVACPDCGAPHHRECWKQNGECVYAKDHGTPRQWRRNEGSSSTAGSPAQHTPTPPHTQHPPNADTGGQVRTCSRCGKANPEFAEFCSRCGHGLNPPDWRSAQPYPHTPHPGQTRQQQYGGFSGGYGEYTPFRMPFVDPFGGVAHDEKIDGVAAEDLVAFVGQNSAYYLPRFYRMSSGGAQTSWNWAAFFFTPYWLLYRKNYLAGSTVLFLSLVSSFINSFVMNNFIFPALDMSSESAMMESILSLMRSGRHMSYFYIIFLLFVIRALIMFIFGLAGNAVYKSTAIKRIKRIGEKTGISRIDNGTPHKTSVISDYRRELSAQGGVSFVLVAIASGILWFGQMLFSALFLSI